MLDLAPIARAAVFSSMSDGVIVLDGARRIVDLNPAAEQILGKPPAAVLGQAASNVLGVSLETGLGEGRRITRQDLAIGTGASQRDYELRYSPLHGARNDPVGWLIVLRDVTDRKALEQQLRYQAFHDSLTGLVNRRMFLDRLDQALGGERPVQVAVLFIDLDGFKEINDRFGHAAGDELLKAVAKRLAGCTRAEDLIVRYGGDEFAVLIAPVGDEADIRRVADRALAAIGEPFAIGGRTVQIGGSAGYAFADAGSRADDLLHRADVALYAAKAAGKGRAAAYQPRLEVEPAFLTD
ncbi:MAG: diguanylate cyclase [Dehalococcoidia bacterium]